MAETTTTTETTTQPDENKTNQTDNQPDNKVDNKATQENQEEGINIEDISNISNIRAEIRNRTAKLAKKEHWISKQEKEIEAKKQELETKAKELEELLALKGKDPMGLLNRLGIDPLDYALKSTPKKKEEPKNYNEDEVLSRIEKSMEEKMNARIQAMEEAQLKQQRDIIEQQNIKNLTKAVDESLSEHTYIDAFIQEGNITMSDVVNNLFERINDDYEETGKNPTTKDIKKHLSEINSEFEAKINKFRKLAERFNSPKIAPEVARDSSITKSESKIKTLSNKESSERAIIPSGISPEEKLNALIKKYTQSKK